MSTTASASSFSKLLRQSKFATYDPAIHQAYTSFGGYSHRGHWGTKRDLPPKRKHKVSDPLVSSSGSRGNARRNPVAFISALDSAEGQTEWASAEKDVRWLRRLEEVGTGVQLNEGSAWNKRVGSSRGRSIGAIDSEFDMAESAKKIGEQTTSALPNTQAMSERRFRSYVTRLRTQRQEFHEFLQESGLGQTEKLDGTPGAPEVVPMYHYAQGPTTHHTRFLAYNNQQAAIQPDSRSLTPVPHPSGGLDYLNPNPLVSRLLRPDPIKGRYIQNSSKSQSQYPYPQKYEDASIVSVAGYNASLVASEANSQAVDWQKLVERDFSQSAEKTTSDYRVEKLVLSAVPRVVGQSRQNVEGAEIKMHVRDWSKYTEQQENPHRPGSFEYISHEDNRTLDASPMSFKARMVSPIPTQKYGEDLPLYSPPGTELLDILDSILQADTPKGAASKKRR